MGIISRDRAVAVTSSFPGISGIIQLVFLWPQGHRMTLGVTAMLALRSLAAPPAFTWASAGARSTQVLLCLQICSTADAEPDAPVDIWSLPSLLGSGGSLAPLRLCAGLWTSPVLAVHHQTWPPPAPRACVPSFCSVREESMFLLLLQIMKLSFFFFSNKILGSDQVDKN